MPQAKPFLLFLAATLLAATPASAQFPARQPGEPLGPYVKEYGGTFEWTESLKGPNSWFKETVMAVVSAGRVSCRGTYQSEEGSVAIAGDGLIEIEFKGPSNKQVYSVRVACPQAYIGKPLTPAAWSHSQDTYEQPGGPRFDATANKLILPDTLRGTTSAPSADNDPANGVSGTLSLTWKLCRGCVPPPPRP